MSPKNRKHSAIFQICKIHENVTVAPADTIDNSYEYEHPQRITLTMLDMIISYYLVAKDAI